MAAKKYAEFFTKKNDGRVGLFLEVMERMYHDKPYTFDNETVDPIFNEGIPVPDEMKNHNYANTTKSKTKVTRDDGKGVKVTETEYGDDCSRESISREWVTFFADMIHSIINGNDDMIKRRIDLIKMLSREAPFAPKTINTLIKNLVRKFYQLTKSDGNILSSGELGKISNILIYNPIDYITFLFGTIPGINSLSVEDDKKIMDALGERKAEEKEEEYDKRYQEKLKEVLGKSVEGYGKIPDEPDCLNTFMDLGIAVYHKLKLGKVQRLDDSGNPEKDDEGNDIMDNVIGYTPSLRSSFTFKYSKYVVKWLDEDNTEDNAFNFFDGIETKKYYRDGKNIVSKDKSGRIIVHNGDHFTRIASPFKCKDIGLDRSHNPSDPVCTGYIQKCLNGTDIKECAKYLGDEQNFMNIDEEIKSLDPYIIEKTIKGLHLQKDKMQTPYSTSKLWMLKDYNEWLCFLKKELESEDFKKIKANTNLQKYVQILIAYVNSEPAILNHDFVDTRTVKTTRIFDPRFLSSGRLAQYGIKPNIPSSNGIMSISSEQQRMREFFNQYHFLVRDLFGIKGPNGLNGTLLPNMPRPMLGGGKNNIQALYDNPVKRSYSILRSYYDKLVESLSQLNKEIAPNERQQIEEYLDKLRTSEEALLKVANVVENYIKLINLFGEDHETSLSLNKMKELVEERNSKFERLSGRHVKILGVFESLAQSIDDNLDPKLL